MKLAWLHKIEKEKMSEKKSESEPDQIEK